MQVDVRPAPAAVAIEAARQVAALAHEAIASRGRFVVSLSGGSTPRAMHASLAKDHRERVDWGRVEFYWSDERLVPPGDADSNYRMARETLLEPLGIAAERVHRIRGETGEARAVADDYAREIAAGVDVVSGWPTFDLVLLGMGGDGHTASLFPFTEALDVADRWVVPGRAPKPPFDRVTLGFPVIHAARAVRVVVTGGEKAGVLAEVLAGTRDPRRLPAQRIAESRGDVRWIVDAAASPAT
jgi:6-phosphogluconolactonase